MVIMDTMRYILIAATLAGLFAGCDAQPVETLPACDTLRAVRFVSRCDDTHARCALLSTAPPGAEPAGCQITIVAVPGGPEQVECVTACD
jgi:hypothetical protein